VPLKIVYLLTCRALGLAVLVFWRDKAKDAESRPDAHELNMPSHLAIRPSAARPAFPRRISPELGLQTQIGDQDRAAPAGHNLDARRQVLADGGFIFAETQKAAPPAADEDVRGRCLRHKRAARPA
jgi:hypothetical protein